MSAKRITEEDRKRILNQDEEVTELCMRAYMEQLHDLAEIVVDRLQEIRASFRDEIILSRTGIVFAIDADIFHIDNDEDGVPCLCTIGVGCRDIIRKIEKSIDEQEAKVGDD